MVKKRQVKAPGVKLPTASDRQRLLKQGMDKLYKPVMDADFDELVRKFR